LTTAPTVLNSAEAVVYHMSLIQTTRYLNLPVEVDGLARCPSCGTERAFTRVKIIADPELPDEIALTLFVDCGDPRCKLKAASKNVRDVRLAALGIPFSPETSEGGYASVLEQRKEKEQQLNNLEKSLALRERQVDLRRDQLAKSNEKEREEVRENADRKVTRMQQKLDGEMAKIRLEREEWTVKENAMNRALLRTYDRPSERGLSSAKEIADEMNEEIEEVEEPTPKKKSKAVGKKPRKVAVRRKKKVVEEEE